MRTWALAVLLAACGGGAPDGPDAAPLPAPIGSVAVRIGDRHFDPFDSVRVLSTRPDGDVVDSATASLGATVSVDIVADGVVTVVYGYQGSPWFAAVSYVDPEPDDVLVTGSTYVWPDDPGFSISLEHVDAPSATGYTALTSCGLTPENGAGWFADTGCGSADVLAIAWDGNAAQAVGYAKFTGATPGAALSVDAWSTPPTFTLDVDHVANHDVSLEAWSAIGDATARYVYATRPASAADTATAAGPLAPGSMIWATAGIDPGAGWDSVEVVTDVIPGDTTSWTLDAAETPAPIAQVQWDGVALGWHRGAGPAEDAVVTSIRWDDSTMWRAIAPPGTDRIVFPRYAGLVPPTGNGDLMVRLEDFPDDEGYAEARQRPEWQLVTPMETELSRETHATSYRATVVADRF